MRVFVGYGYNDRDKWVETYVLPLVKAFGCEVVHGKTVFGGALPDEVFKLIRSSDAMIGFTTRRDPAGKNLFSTHPWVVQELTAAHAQDPPIPFVEVREEGVVSPGGVIEAANAQRIDYRETDRTACLVQVAEALRRFRELTSITTVRLGPDMVVGQISPFLDDASFICRCQTLRGGFESAARAIPVFPIRGSLFVQLRGIAERELVRLTVSAGGHTWRSNYESVDTVDIQLKGKE